MATLYIKKLPDGYFEFTVNGDTENKITNTRNDLTAIGEQLHFKTSNGANLVQKQEIYPADCTLDVEGTISYFISVQDAFSKLKLAGFFDWMFGEGGGGGVDRFEDLLDTFDYTGNEGMTVKVNETLQRLEPVPYKYVENITDLNDVPSTIVPGKILVGNEYGTAFEYTDLPEEQPQYLNSVGSFNFQDLSGQTTAQSIPSSTYTLILNDAEGANTIYSNAPYAVSTVYNADDNEFDFTDLSIGDVLTLRIDFSLQTTTANQVFKIIATHSQGSPSETSRIFGFEQIKNSGTNNFTFSIPFSVKNADFRDYPAQLLIISDASCDMTNVNYYVEIIRKNINIVDVEFDPTILITQEIRSGVTTTTPSEDAVYDALALKANITYVDTQDAATLSSANSYTDTALSGIDLSGKEDVSNKSNDIEVDKASVIKYGNISAWIYWLKTWLVSNLSTKSSLVDADTIIIGNSADSNKTNKISWTNFKNLFKTINGNPIFGSGDLVIGAASFLRHETSWTSGTQIFTLPFDYAQVYSVEVQGQGALSTSQYNLVSPNKVQILDTLNTGDYIVILYSKDTGSVNPYYTQAETDTLLNVKQDILTSGGNIKTLQGNSLLGSGNLDILTGNVDILEQVEISSSGNVQTSWAGKIIIFTSSCTITVPTSLPTNFSFQGVTLAGVTITWAISSPKTWLFGTPASTLEKSTFSLLQKGNTNNIILLQ